ncbi:Isoflavone reductase P3 [Phytophthora cinnamomi]|uniref:Isoflavone reductase P3 n=1 Tax=Phytophthora cinnamomi TaxID=4785 RepID=UPI003559388B|nr:Isoflavone reductase P3 [Phytophthora cinnamomi]
MPATTFYTGIFAEFLPIFMDYHFDEGYMNVVGKGETPYSITSRTDAGRFVAHVLSTAPKSALENAKLPFEAERLSPLQIHTLAEKKLGKKIEVRYITYEENMKKFDTDFTAFLTALGEDGRGVAGSEQEVNETVAKFFPDWNPAPYEAFLT